MTPFRHKRVSRVAPAERANTPDDSWVRGKVSSGGWASTLLSGGLNERGARRHSCALAQLGRFVLAYWRVAPTREGVALLERTFKLPGFADGPKPIYIGVVNARGGFPDSAVRAGLVEVVHDADVEAIAMIVDGPPLLAGTLLAILGKMNLVLRTRVQRNAFGDDESAVTWLHHPAKVLEGDDQARALKAALASLRTVSSA